MKTEPEGSVHPPLLILVSDEPDFSATVRSGEREIQRWSADGSCIVEGTFERCFTGEPTDPATYRWTESAPSITVVIELRDLERARSIEHAVRTVRPDAAVLILCDGCDEAPGDGTLARSGRLRDVLRLDLDEELQRLESQRRVHRLRRFAGDVAVVPILVHPDPDPDAVSAALAVRALLRRKPDEAPIVTECAMTRPENRRMADLLHIQVTEVSEAELRALERVIAVDTQPAGFGEQRPRLAVIDHHPQEICHAEFADIRPGLGACATMLTQYLRADDERRIGPTMATALLHGIRTDTDSLTRGVTPADVEAYAFLQKRADLALLRRLERGVFTRQLFRSFVAALAEAGLEGEALVAFLGSVDSDEAHKIADLADFGLGVEGVLWSVGCAFAGDTFAMAIRYQGTGEGAGPLARRISGNGSGGGHAFMARVEWPAAEAVEKFGGMERDAVTNGVLRLLRENSSAG